MLGLLFFILFFLNQHKGVSMYACENTHTHTQTAASLVFIFLHSSNVSTSSRLLLRFLGNLWAALSQNPSLRLEPATCTDRNTRKAPATTSILFRTACLRAHRKNLYHLIWKQGGGLQRNCSCGCGFSTTLSLLLLCAHVLQSIDISLTHHMFCAKL